MTNNIFARTSQEQRTNTISKSRKSETAETAGSLAMKSSEKSYLAMNTYDTISINSPYSLNIDFTNRGLYKTLEEDYGIKIDKAIETFRATELNAQECKLLHCPKKQYGLLVKRTSYCNNTIVCYSTIVSKGDTFEFTVQLG